ncbi:STAS domain-containing protein [Streptomyces sp. WMMB 322]|uniref:STAS domain-containing protein n=1 Tax=Streptomyces sp. WMMB 322 TaxID=1286821 RepID=UPI0006E1B28C|nr:STAS domain-containing protein [Streptomyces sp. WMMB 322]
MNRPNENRSPLTVTVLAGVQGGEDILLLSGRLDVLTMHTLRDYVWYCLSRNQRRIRLDMAGISQCESGALHGVAGLQEGLSAAGGYLRITSASESVREARNAVRLPRDFLG